MDFLFMKDTIPSSSFCVLPWIHMASKTWGAILPCCVGRSLKDNLNSSTFSKAWNGSSMRELRVKMLRGEQSNICERCYNEEKSGVDSHRIRSNRFWNEYFPLAELAKKTSSPGHFDGKMAFLDLRLGNKCNLICNMCGPNEAILWKKMAQEGLKKAKTNYLKNYMNYYASNVKNTQTWYKRKEVIEDIYRHIPSLRRMVIAGGEPLLIKEHHQLLDECIRQNRAKQITLHYHTNGTICNSELLEKWKHFECVMVFVSLDGLKDQNHYIRYPCSWKLIEKNLNIFDKRSPENVHPMILYTVQAMNILYLSEFLSWLLKGKFKKLHLHDSILHTEPVHYPAFLSCQILPQQAKKIITKKIKKLSNTYGSKVDRIGTIVDFMNQEDKSSLLPVFKDYTVTLDKIRGTCFEETFPELKEMI